MSVRENVKLASGSLQTKISRDLFSPIMTPENIPQFTIPPLALQDSQRIFPAKKAIAWKSHQWHSQDDVMWDRKARRSCSDPVGKQGTGSLLHRVDDLPDPVTRAAMSLPHLAKVTTPYGFVTLGESPQVANKESVFFQKVASSPVIVSMGSSSSLQDSGVSDTIEAFRINDITHNTEGPIHIQNTPGTVSQSPTRCLTENNFREPRRPLFSRRISVPAGINPDKEVFMMKEWSPPMICQRSNSLPKINTKLSSRNLFQSVLKKHLYSRKQTKPQSLDEIKTASDL